MQNKAFCEFKREAFAKKNAQLLIAEINLSFLQSLF